MVRSDLARELGGFRTEMEPAEDFDFFVRCCQRTKVSYNTDVIVMMRRHDGNTDDRELRKASIRIAKDNLQQGGDASSTVGAHPLWLLRLADDHYALSDIRSFSYYLKALWHGWRGFEAKETRRAVIQACKSLVPGAIRRGLRRGE